MNRFHNAILPLLPFAILGTISCGEPPQPVETETIAEVIQDTPPQPDLAEAEPEELDGPARLEAERKKALARRVEDKTILKNIATTDPNNGRSLGDSLIGGTKKRNLNEAFAGSTGVSQGTANMARSGLRRAGSSGHKGAGSIEGMGDLYIVGSGTPRLGAKAKHPDKSPSAPVQGQTVPKPASVNGFKATRAQRQSTFSIDVDTGSYTISRRHLLSKTLPPAQAVRVEEFVNFFKYDYAQPTGEVPFGVDFEAAPSPFGGNSVFLKIGVQGKTLTAKERKPAHLVFLVDVSGSMGTHNKLPLAQRSLHLLVEQLQDGDTVALATYAGNTAIVLEPTGMSHRAQIHQAIEDLNSGGSTAMASGLENAYKLAYKTLKPGHVNRVIVLSDGDANVGGSSHTEILKRIEHFTKEGVTLSTIGFGMGNYKDTTMEQLANKGNGNYYYIDSFKQARRIFQEQLGGTLQVIAKDVKIQVDFDPKAVASYRLVGYENRHIANRDFRNDAVDAGEIGSGHTVTAIYELKLTKDATANPAVVRIRHKAPQGARATETAYDFTRDHLKASFDESSRNFRLALTAMAFADKLRESPYAGKWAWKRIETLVDVRRGTEDERELVGLIRDASLMKR